MISRPPLLWQLDFIFSQTFHLKNGTVSQNLWMEHRRALPVSSIFIALPGITAICGLLFFVLLITGVTFKLDHEKKIIFTIWGSRDSFYSLSTRYGSSIYHNRQSK